MTPARHVSQLPSSYIREILAAASAPDCISFAGGLPSAEHFPLKLVEKAVRDCTSMTPLFQYGNTSGLAALVDHLRITYQLSQQQSLLITNGSQQGIDLIARSFLNPGDAVVMEIPSYLGAIQAFSLAQAKIHGVEQTHEGPNLAHLEDILAEHKVKIFYCVPDFHNPSGVCWSLEVRREVIRICLKHNVLILEDAPYRQLRFSGETLPSLFSLCSEQVLRLNSFSKIAMPGLRLGSVHGETKLMQNLEKVKQASDLHTNLPNQYILHQLLTHAAYPTHLGNLRRLYQERYDTMKAHLRSELAEKASFNEVEGGMFIWLELHSGNDISIAKAALANGVAVVPGSVFYANNTQYNSAPTSKLRLNFSACNETLIKQGITRLSHALP